MSYNSYRKDRSGWVVFAVIAAIVIAAVVGIYLFFAGAMYNSLAVNARGWGTSLEWAFYSPGGWPTPFSFLLITLALLIGAIIWYMHEDTRLTFAAAIVAGALFLSAIGFASVKSFTYNIDGSGYYLSTTSFAVEDPDELPDILAKQAGLGNVTIPIEEGSLPTGWVPRVASATGALNVIKKTSDAVNNTALMEDTISYVYGDGDSGVWTGIRNGSNQQAIYGVATWNGTGDRSETCEFTGDYELEKSFGGLWGKNLWEPVATAYPNFLFDQSDMWGYCNGDEPIIVIPGVDMVGFDFRTVDESAGVVTIKGSKSGDPVLDFHSEIKPGEFPGPVYPQKLVNAQRDSLDWAGGYWATVNERFGFETTSVAAQSGNNSNYLLKSEEDGRLYWATPLRPQSTDSQTLIAYSITLADELSSGVLNHQTVYVLNEDDPRVVNLDDLQSRVTSSVSEANPGFFTSDSPGAIVEFLPVSDTMWQAFAEVNGRVKYRIDIDVNARITPEVFDIDAGEAATVPEASGDPASCDDPASLSDAQLADCLVSLTQELGQRQGGTSE